MRKSERRKTHQTVVVPLGTTVADATEEEVSRTRRRTCNDGRTPNSPSERTPPYESITNQTYVNLNKWIGKIFKIGMGNIKTMNNEGN
jgi:hypothetical protein